MPGQPWSQLRKAKVEIIEPESHNKYTTDASPTDSTNLETTQSVWQNMNPEELFKKLTFGGIVGFTTGGSFGAVDGVKAARLKSPMALVKEGGRFQFVLSSAARTGFMFGGFFTLYQGVKYSTQQFRGKNDGLNSVVATAVSLAPMAYFPSFRARFPYAVMLIAMDIIQTEVID